MILNWKMTLKLEWAIKNLFTNHVIRQRDDNAMQLYIQMLKKTHLN